MIVKSIDAFNLWINVSQSGLGIQLARGIVEAEGTRPVLDNAVRIERLTRGDGEGHHANRNGRSNPAAVTIARTRISAQVIASRSQDKRERSTFESLLLNWNSGLFDAEEAQR